MWRVVRLHRWPLVRRLGRRGVCLVLLGIIWTAIGASTLLSPLHDRFSAPGPGDALEWMDGPWVGGLWGAAGLVALVVGLTHDRRRIAAHDAVGFNALITPPVASALFYGWSAILLPWGEGNHRAPLGFAVELAVCVLILLVAGWPEPPERPEEWAAVRSDRGR